jgi:hypothetical protein
VEGSPVFKATLVALHHQPLDINMFRVFLGKKLPNKKPARTGKKTAVADDNRRKNIRYDMDHKHLTLMNDQDIYQIRDVSKNGFSTFASKRTLQRVTTGDTYESKIRYVGATYALTARVSWTSNEAIGFTCLDSNPQTKEFLARILQPMTIGSTLTLMECDLVKKYESSKTHYVGSHNSNLFIWTGRDGIVDAWQLIIDQSFLEWSHLNSLSSGNLADTVKSSMFDLSQEMLNKTHEVSTESIQFATDVIMGSSIKEQEQIINTLNIGELYERWG